MAMASRSSVRAFLVEQGGRACDCVLICVRQAAGNLDVRACSDAAKGIAAAARKERQRVLIVRGRKGQPALDGGGAHRGKDMPGGKTETEADSSLGLRRRRRAARLDIAGDRSGVVMPVDRAGEQSRPGAKREAGASQGDNRFMTRSIKWSGITKRRWA